MIQTVSRIRAITQNFFHGVAADIFYGYHIHKQDGYVLDNASSNTVPNIKSVAYNSR